MNNHDEQRLDLRGLIASAEQPGPLPDGLEDQIWQITAHTYRDARDRATGTGDGDAQAIVVDLTNASTPNEPRVRLRSPRWVFAAAAALIATAVGAIAVVTLRQPSTSPDPADQTATAWAEGATSANTNLRDEITDADDTRTRSGDLGIATLHDYLEAVSRAASVAAIPLAEAPPALATEASAHAGALVRWADAAAALADDILADPNTFVAGGEPINQRLADVLALEAAALDDSCADLAAALARLEGADSTLRLDCGAISTSPLGGPP